MDAGLVDPVFLHLCFIRWAHTLGPVDDEGQEEIHVEEGAVSVEFSSCSFQCHRILQDGRTFYFRI